MAGLVHFNRKNSISRRGGFEDFYNLLDDFFTDPFPSNRNFSRDTFKMDIEEKENEYIIEAELPGIKKEEINLELHEGRLIIAISKEEKEDVEEKNYVHRERIYSSMSRSIYLGDIKEDSINAKLDEGILLVTVAKKEEDEKRKSIPIE